MSEKNKNGLDRLVNGLDNEDILLTISVPVNQIQAVIDGKMIGTHKDVDDLSNSSNSSSSINNNNNNTKNKFKNKEDILDDYNQCSCGTGCMNRTLCLPLLISCSCFTMSGNICAPCLIGQIIYSPICMLDFLCVDSCPDYCLQLNPPVSIGVGEFKAVIKSNTLSLRDRIKLKDFDVDDVEYFLRAIAYAQMEFKGKKTDIIFIDGNYCEITDNICKLLNGLIRSLPNVNHFEFKNSELSENGFLYIIDSIIKRDPPKKLHHVEVLDKTGRKWFANEMIAVYFDGNINIREEIFLIACKKAESVQYPLFISLSGIPALSNQNIFQAIRNLRLRNANVVIYLGFDEYLHCYIKNISPLIAPKEVDEMSRHSPRDDVPQNGVEFGIWKKRVDDYTFIYLSQNRNEINVDKTILKVFETKTFEDIVNDIKNKHPNVSIPSGWKRDVDNHFCSGMIPANVLNSLKKQKHVN